MTDIEEFDCICRDTKDISKKLNLCGSVICAQLRAGMFNELYIEENDEENSQDSE